MLRLALLFALALSACADSPETPPTPPPLDSDGALAEADAPEVYISALDTGDATLESGEFVESYQAVAREGQWIRIQVVSGDFDPYLLILSPTGVQTDVDDSAEGNTSMTKAILEATEGGEWQINVTSYAVGGSGDYELSVEVLDERPMDAGEGQPIQTESAAPEGIEV